MKKFLALVIVVAMTLTLAVNVFAETATKQETGNQTVDVNVSTTTDTITPVYYVEVEWAGLDFTYKFGTDAGWDVANKNHKYTGKTNNSGWGDARATTATGTITVTNHSNVGITVSHSADKIAGGDDLTVDTAFASEKTGTVVAATPNSEWESAANTVINVTVGGTPSGITNSTKVATVTVTIA